MCGGTLKRHSPTNWKRTMLTVCIQCVTADWLLATIDALILSRCRYVVMSIFWWFQARVLLQMVTQRPLADLSWHMVVATHLQMKKNNIDCVHMVAAVDFFFSFHHFIIWASIDEKRAVGQQLVPSSISPSSKAFPCIDSCDDSALECHPPRSTNLKSFPFRRKF